MNMLFDAGLDFIFFFFQMLLNIVKLFCNYILTDLITE